MQAGAALDEEGSGEENPSIAMPDVLNELASMFPHSVGSNPKSQTYANAMDMLFASLPPTPCAWSLFEAYMENATWVFQPVRRENLIEDILTPIYNAKKEREESAATPNTWADISPHKLAVLYIIFAIGAVVDLTLPPFNAEGEKYYHCARAALALRSIFDSPLIETVEAIILMGHYRTCVGEKYSRDSTWTMIGLGAKLAINVSGSPFASVSNLF